MTYSLTKDEEIRRLKFENELLKKQILDNYEVFRDYQRASVKYSFEKANFEDIIEGLEEDIRLLKLDRDACLLSAQCHADNEVKYIELYNHCYSKLVEIHDMVGRPLQQTSHDFVGCAIEKINDLLSNEPKLEAARKLAGHLRMGFDKDLGWTQAIRGGFTEYFLTEFERLDKVGDPLL